MFELKIKQPFFILLIALTIFIFLASFALHLFLMTKAENDATASTSPAFFWWEVIIQIIIWTFILFLIGYFISKVFIENASLIERIILSFSIVPITVITIDFFIIGAITLQGFETNEIFFETIVVIGLILLSIIGIFIRRFFKPSTLK